MQDFWGPFKHSLITKTNTQCLLNRPGDRCTHSMHKQCYKKVPTHHSTPQQAVVVLGRGCMVWQGCRVGVKGSLTLNQFWWDKGLVSQTPNLLPAGVWLCQNVCKCSFTGPRRKVATILLGKNSTEVRNLSRLTFTPKQNAHTHTHAYTHTRQHQG